MRLLYFCCVGVDNGVDDRKIQVTFLREGLSFSIIPSMAYPYYKYLWITPLLLTSLDVRTSSFGLIGADLKELSQYVTKKA